jgi:deoxyribodipyrimidine photo-lyase
MRFASYWTHYAKIHRKKLADRTYYHFIDGELGSNHLSWQRVQSTFSHKPYFMNEENLTRYRPGSSDALYR